MTDLSTAIAQNIANRRREPTMAERSFMILNAAADGVGVGRRALGRAAVMAADGIGYVRVRLIKFAPILGSVLTSKAALMAEAAAEARREKAEEAAAIVPKAVARRWEAKLKKMGKIDVRHYLEETAHLPANAPFLKADTGLKHGATRYPTRGFVVEWAEDAPDDEGGLWRGLTIAAIIAMIGSGVLLWYVL